MENTIGERLKAFRKKTKTKMPKLARELNISKEKLYKWEKGVKPSNFEQYDRLDSYLKEREELLEKGLPMPPDLNWPNDVEMNLPEPKEHSKLSYRDVTVPNVHSVVNFMEDGMAPNYRPGCRLCLSKVPDAKKLAWGNVYYFVDLNGQGVLRRAYQADDTNKLKLVSYNPVAYPDIIRAYDELRNVFEVVAILLK